ncbi:MULTISPECIES: CbtA family protein [Pseudomonas]|uniref:CbtA family protein n=1 Tax=Pseudomonas TaxID=286 RepID=UPI0023EEA4A6|nr:CbtA family protein [Pseudomonas sputi]
MTGRLLARGMIAGLLAGILAFTFATVFGEPQIELAIAYEDVSSHSHQHGHGEADSEMGMETGDVVSREIQSTFGLLTGMLVYSMSLGGIFSLVFAYALGRTGTLSPRALALMLAVSAFIVINLIPGLKYPANPPATNNSETIGLRTVLFFLMIVVSVVAALFSIKAARRMRATCGDWNAATVGISLYILIIAVAGYFFPTVSEIPDDFSAVLLWRFRIASIGVHVVLWSSLGLLFGWLSERLISSRSLISRRVDFSKQ